MNKYGFYGRLKETFPAQAIVDVCEVCNYRCIHCPQSSIKHSDSSSMAFLSNDLNKKLVGEVSKFGKRMTQQILNSLEFFEFNCETRCICDKTASNHYR